MSPGSSPCLLLFLIPISSFTGSLNPLYSPHTSSAICPSPLFFQGDLAAASDGHPPPSLGNTDCIRINHLWVTYDWPTARASRSWNASSTQKLSSLPHTSLSLDFKDGSCTGRSKSFFFFFPAPPPPTKTHHGTRWERNEIIRIFFP